MKFTKKLLLSGLVLALGIGFSGAASAEERINTVWSIRAR